MGGKGLLSIISLDEKLRIKYTQQCNLPISYRDTLRIIDGKQLYHSVFEKDLLQNIPEKEETKQLG